MGRSCKPGVSRCTAPTLPGSTPATSQARRNPGVTGTRTGKCSEDSHSYPYFFNDDNGRVDDGEGRCNSRTPRLLRAACNHQSSQKDPGAFAHNGAYMIQVFYDSLEDLSTKVPVDMSGMTRP